ncbi:TPA: DUF3892 domain-containing protein [Vibrio cholerae]|nr:DUF3892 domain-containing protein [Vibrio cholerae]
MKNKNIATCVVRDSDDEIIQIGFNGNPPIPYNVAIKLTTEGLTNLELFTTKSGRLRLRQEGDNDLTNNLDNLPSC